MSTKITKRNEKTISPIAKGYLIAYNGIQTLGWSYLLYQLFSYYTTSQSLSLYDSVKWTVMIFQNAAFLEIIHCYIRIVPSNVVLTFFQVMSRIIVVCGVLEATYSSRESIGLTLCLFAWCVTEIIRYAMYTLGILKAVPYFLLWMRYSLFVFLYPIGITGELLCIYAAQKEVAKGNLYSLQMPNAYNFNFNYQYVLIFIMLLYIPLFPQLYLHMFAQRKKALGPKQSDQKSK